MLNKNYIQLLFPLSAVSVKHIIFHTPYLGFCHFFIITRSLVKLYPSIICSGNKINIISLTPRK